MKTKSKKSVITGRDPESQLYRAVERYVKSKNGSVLVIGGVRIEKFPEDLDGTFYVAVRCTGSRPEPAK